MLGPEKAGENEQEKKRDNQIDKLNYRGRFYWSDNHILKHLEREGEKEGGRERERDRERWTPL